MEKTNEELKKEIENLINNELKKKEKADLEKELQELKDENNTSKKLLKGTGRFFLGVGKAMNKYAKGQAEKKDE